MDAQTGLPRLTKPRILIVDDDPAVRRSMQLLLQGQGFDVRGFPSGEALLADAGFSSAACLIADFRLGKLDGLVLLSTLRGLGWEGPAVLVTAFPSGPLADQAIASGYTAVFEKPLRERSLIEAVKRLAAHGGQPANVKE